ncbi:hypothetical protein CROQUDRAFT_35501, partial [Cronartium quercuum f. sp. fusiforme G11]
FDDGPGELSKDINNLLKINKAKASFFINGNNEVCIFDHANELISRFYDGHLIGNHGWSHAHMKNLDKNDMHNQLARVEDAMIKILGVKPLYFRPPYGKSFDFSDI